MKFSMNGAPIIGTLDGANIEIRDNIGHENVFIFGATAQEVDGLRQRLKYVATFHAAFKTGAVCHHDTLTKSLTPSLIREGKLPKDKRFNEVLRMISMGLFGDAKIFEPLISTLTEGRDRYLLSYDFNDYLRAQKDVDEAWKNKKQWARMSIMSTAGIASFSSDRTIQRYAKEIWSINVSLDILL